MVVLDWPIRIDISMIFIQFKSQIGTFKNPVVRMFSNSTIQKTAVFEYVRTRIFGICEHSKSLEYSEKIREHNYGEE